MRYLIFTVLVVQLLTLGMLFTLFNDIPDPSPAAIAFKDPTTALSSSDTGMKIAALGRQLDRLSRRMEAMQCEGMPLTASSQSNRGHAADSEIRHDLSSPARAIVDDARAIGRIAGDDWRRIHSRAARLDTTERLAVYSEIARAINAGELFVDANTRL